MKKKRPPEGGGGRAEGVGGLQGCVLEKGEEGLDRGVPRL